MSGLYENQKTLRQLRSMISDIMPKNQEKIYFITSFPRSDMGKGTLVAQLLKCTPHSDAIKFDGLLNTNANGRHTARGHDDFGIYEKFNPGKKWADEHYLLGGELYRDFIEQFGENENLQFNPHLSMYVEYRIYKMWDEIGRPQHLFVEVGGTLLDPEVQPIFVPMIQRMSAGNLIPRVVLLSELAFNGDYIKTKSIQDGVRMLQSQQIKPWLIIARDTKDISKVTFDERLEFERVISSKLYDQTNMRLLRIISVPYYDNLNEYSSYIKSRFMPLISPVDDDYVIIATGNMSKYDDFRIYIGNKCNIKMPSESERVAVPEGVSSIEDNAIAKARAYAVKYNKVAIGDDTGFFIRSLNGEPGVALRRWGGELPESATQKEFWEYLQNKTKDLDDLSAYFSQCICVATPDGQFEIIDNKNNGYLDRKSLSLSYNGSAYPLGAAFKSSNRTKTWDEMTDQEKYEFDIEIAEKLEKTLRDIGIINQ